MKYYVISDPHGFYDEMIKALKEAGVDEAVLELKKFEALISMSNGVASKIIVPTDAVSMVKSNVIFSETTGLGDVTKPAEKAKEEIKEDVCCDEIEPETLKERKLRELAETRAKRKTNKQ